MRKKRQLLKAFLPVLIIILLLNVFPITSFADDNADQSGIIVSMGDSYSSGEGVEPFYGEDEDISERVKNADWLAHRSEQAWSGQLTLPGVGVLNNYRYGSKDVTDPKWYFVASSGAKVDDLFGKQNKPYSRSGYYGKKYLPAQIDVFDILEDTPEYITLSIGGNDADFGGIIKEAICTTYFTPCRLSDKLNDVWNEFYMVGGIREKLINAYETLDRKTDSRSTIIVVGYPQLLNSEGGLLGIFSAEEAAMINDSVTIFNQAIEMIVDECRTTKNINIVFVSVEEAFRGHGAYSSNPYIREIVPLPQSQDLFDHPSDKQFVSAYSLHPNEKGIEAYRQCVQNKIDELEAVRGTRSAENTNVPNDATEAFIDFLRDGYEGADDYYNDLPIHFDKQNNSNGDIWMTYAIDDFDSDGQKELIIYKSFFEREYTTDVLHGLFFYKYKNNSVELVHYAYFLEEMVLNPGFLIFYDNGQVYMENELKSLTVFVFNEKIRQKFKLNEGDRIIYSVNNYDDMSIRRSVGGAYAYDTSEVISNESYQEETDFLFSGTMLDTTMHPVNKAELW